jgi:cell division protein FtsB
MRIRWRPYVLAPLIGAGIAGALLAVDGKHGLTQLVGLRARTQHLESCLTELERERSQLVRTVHRLRNDPLAVERLAREKLGLVQPGELVIRLGNGPDDGPGLRPD